MESLRHNLNNLLLFIILTVFISLLQFIDKLLIFLFIFRSFKWGVSNYPLGELLMNYKCGFIRRGFVGEFLYQFSSTLHVSPLSIIKIFLPIVYFFVLQISEHRSGY